MRIKLTTFLVISFLINSAQTGRIIGVVFGRKTARSRDKHMIKLLNRFVVSKNILGIKKLIFL